MADEDLAIIRQEIEALRNIYDAQFHVHSDLSYTIDLDDGNELPAKKLSVEINIPYPGYPSSASPDYNIHAPWLRGESRRLLCLSLDKISRDSIGEQVVFKWLSEIKSFIDVFTAQERTGIAKRKTFKMYRYDEVSGDLPDPSVECTDQSCTEESVDDDVSESWVPSSTLEEKEATVQDSVDAGANSVVSLPVIHHGEPIYDRKSVFQGHIARITHKDQVKLVMDHLLENKKIAEATHNIVAYRVECGSKRTLLTGNVDDGETHASSRMLHLLELMDAKNVIVVVTRWYGGTHLGTDRFKHINSCMTSLLEEHGFRKEQITSKKGPKTQTDASQNQLQNRSTTSNLKPGKKLKQ